VYAKDYIRDSGTEFEDVSTLVDFKRETGEGLAGVAWLDCDDDGDLDLDLDLLLTNTIRRIYWWSV